ncbi:MAG: hypothetical protein GY899_08775 [Verrucomicrobiaceae bacterium]|nr:hypothetical protein [Verrucomicrobiaceae bacterium]
MKKKNNNPDRYYDQFDGEVNAEWFAAQDATWLERERLGMNPEPTPNQRDMETWRIEMQRQKAGLLGKK